MNKDQAIGLLRHAATIAGTILSTSTDARYQAAGVALIAIAAGHSYRAKRVPKLQVPDINLPGVHVFACALLGAFALGMMGCSSVPSESGPSQAEYAAAITQPVVKNVVVPILSKNPDLEPALLAVASGIDVVFNKGTLTPEQLREFVDSLSAKYPKLDERDKLVLGSAIWDAYTIYTRMTGKTVVVVSDPTARALLEAFRQGINDGIAFYHAFKPTQTTFLPTNERRGPTPSESDVARELFAGMAVSPAKPELEQPRVTYTQTPYIPSERVRLTQEEPLVVDLGKGWSIEFGD